MMRGTLGVVAAASLLGPSAFAGDQPGGEAPAGNFPFDEVEAGFDLTDHVADGYQARPPLLRWGDELFPDSPAFDPLKQSAAAQLRQFGYNNDYIAYFPFDDSSTHGLLCINHEYTNEELMFPGLKKRQDISGFTEMTPEMVDVEMAAHGVTIVEVEKDGGQWRVVLDSRYNRRISPHTEMTVDGPAAGYYHRHPDPVVPVYWFTDDIAPSVERAIIAYQPAIADSRHSSTSTRAHLIKPTEEPSSERALE